jgi:chromosome segregation ATPase
MRGQLQRWSWPAVALVAVAAAAWQVRINRQQTARLALLAAENDRLRKGAVNLSQAAEPAAVSAAQEPPAKDRSSRCVTAPERSQDDATTQRLTQSLADANASVARMESRGDQAEAEVQSLRSENKRLESSESDLKKSLAAVNQAMDALQDELKSSKDRLAQLETASQQAEISYRKLRDQSRSDAQKLVEIQQLASQLQDIHRRREVYLNGILRRYKQITTEYRSLSGVLQSQHSGTPDVGSADLARIQDSIALAEEDLRQLNNLNAEALLIQKKMAGK